MPAICWAISIEIEMKAGISKLRMHLLKDLQQASVQRFRWNRLTFLDRHRNLPGKKAETGSVAEIHNQDMPSPACCGHRQRPNDVHVVMEWISWREWKPVMLYH